MAEADSLRYQHEVRTLTRQCHFKERQLLQNDDRRERDVGGKKLEFQATTPQVGGQFRMYSTNYQKRHTLQTFPNILSNTKFYCHGSISNGGLCFCGLTRMLMLFYRKQLFC